MEFAIITLFPQIFQPFVATSIIGKATRKGLIKIKLVNLRDFAKGKRKTVDDKPFGGGVGMVIKPDVAVEAIEKISKKLPKPGKTILLSPQGKIFNQNMAINFSNLKSLVIFCGHYEGVDERVSKFVNQQISIGDFILTGGETAAMVMVDAITRNVEGVLPKVESQKESFANNLLAAPVYTRPENFRGLTVPKILLTGNASQICKWRKRQQILRTKTARADLFEKHLKDVTGE